ncbi:MAG: APC family permease [Cellulomonadaceae bacterium]
MSAIADAAKRLLIGRPVRSSDPAAAAVPPRAALPTFAADALSSVAYAPDEILLTLALAGFAATTLSVWVGLAVVVVLAVVVLSYRQNVRAYPSGGGDYEIVGTNLGARAGVTVASALFVDYALTVAVSVSSGAQYAAALIPGLRGHEAVVATAAVVLLTLLHLRGMRRRGRAAVVPVYAFMAVVGLTGVVGAVQLAAGNLATAQSAAYELVPSAAFDQGMTGVAGALLLARAFASGGAAVTGVETISTQVPAFTRPRSRHAATTLALAGAVSGALLLVVLWLARAAGVQYVADPAAQLLLDGAPVSADHVQVPVLAQVADAVFTSIPVVFAVVVLLTAVILLFAASSAFHGFPALAARLAGDDYVPRRLRMRGDRLVLSNGILVLAVLAVGLVWAFGARVPDLIQLYVVGVFTSFTLSQLGMVRHWGRMLRLEHDPRLRAGMRRSRLVSASGLVLTAVVLAVVVVGKFTYGAWAAVLGIGLGYAFMRAVRRYYDRVRDDVAVSENVEDERALPSRVHGLVLVTEVDRPALRTLAYARATRPSVLEAVTVGADPVATAATVRGWEQLRLPVPLRVLDAPFRDPVRPLVAYVRSIRRESPRDLVVVFLPAYVVGHWWERFLHNQDVRRLRDRLLALPGVVVASVPWRLASARTSGPNDPALPPPPERAAADGSGKVSGRTVRPEEGRR